MNTAKKIANANNDNEGAASTRRTGGSQAAKRHARKVNRAAIRADKRHALGEQTELDRRAAEPLPWTPENAARIADLRERA